MNEYYRVAGFTLFCFLLSAFLWPEFMIFSMNQVKDPMIILNTRGTDPLSSGNICFTFAIGLIPLLHFGVNKFANISSFKQKLISLFIILACGLFTWQGRILAVVVKNQRSNSLIEHMKEDVHIEYPINELQPQLYLVFGLAIGVLVSAVIFRKKKLADKKNLLTKKRKVTLPKNAFAYCF
ncbi:hypothetical protein ABWH96_20555 [Marivirga tractuosa]|uniref:hypothetical protein n=1 Tax=Marivirga tractuosa TaxID=1006 RepID=UPI0035D0A9B1